MDGNFNVFMNKNRVMYHTQEKRRKRLSFPAKCQNIKKAWLGQAYYFWDDEFDAIAWGHNSKRNTGYFEIYKSDIDCTNVLDTVFNEEHYIKWKKLIEKAVEKCIKKTGIKPTIREINLYISEKTSFTTETDGVLFQDIPRSNPLVTEMYYRKRIQLAVYNKNIICNFAFHFEYKCN